MKSKDELKKLSIEELKERVRERMISAIEDEIKIAYAVKDRSIKVGKYETRGSYALWLDETLKKEVENAGFEVRDGYIEYEIIL